MLRVNYAEIESKYVGETSKNLERMFTVARLNHSIILFDEADALLSRRVTDMTSATDVSVNQTRSVLLTLLDGYDGMVIFTTNFISNYDPAFMRRIPFHIKFELPNEAQRIALLQHYLTGTIPNQGHGFTAERANDLYDRSTGHNAKIVGDNNAKNGADRFVDGVYIQSKYCKTGSRCVNECFEGKGSGIFRYMLDGKPMQIEVPSDVYDDAVQAMENKIRNGQVPGVTDPKKATEIIRKGHFTYQQAVNISKAGTVESLLYDASTGVVIASSAFGVSALITFATSFWSGEDPEICLQRAAFSGLKIGGITFLGTILSGQLSKAGLNSLLVGSSEKVISVLGPKASAVLINAFRGGESAIYGAAAMKSAAKLLRGNFITGTVTFAIMSSADIARIFCGRISGEQLFKNLLCTAASVGGGSAGALAGASLGSAVLPGIGTAIGGLGGAVVAGTLGEKVVHTAANQFLEDDADKMAVVLQDAFTDLAEEYLLNAEEAEKCVDTLSEQLDGHTLRDMYASLDRKQFALNLIRPIMDDRITKRTLVHLPSKYALTHALQNALESISDSTPVPAPV